ncbi:MAG: HAD hydrolase-like protein [candidate division FCPU426 bacterium]
MIPAGYLWLFDLDGTLVRTGGAGMQAMEQAFTEVMGWREPLAGISPAGRTDPSIVHEVSEKQRGRGMSEAEMERVFGRYLELLEQTLAAAPAFRVLPGIREFLEQAQARPDTWLGLGTGNLEFGAQLKLKRGGLDGYFRFGGFGSDAVDRVDLLRKAVARGETLRGAPLPPERVIVVGDTPHDVAAGMAIGARTVAVATGPFTPAQLAASKAGLVLADFTEQDKLAAWLAGVEGGKYAAGQP